MKIGTECVWWGSGKGGKRGRRLVWRGKRRKEEKGWDKITVSSEMIQSSPWETPLFTNSWAAYPAATPPPNITYTNALPMRVYIYIHLSSYHLPQPPNTTTECANGRLSPLIKTEHMEWIECANWRRMKLGERYTSNLPFSVLVEFFDFGYNSPHFHHPLRILYFGNWNRGGLFYGCTPEVIDPLPHCILPILLLIGLSIQKLFTSGPITINGAENMSV